MNRLALISLAMAVAATAASASFAQSAAPDAAHGAVLFKQRCAVCHAGAPDAPGPKLNGVFGRKAGSVPGFDYSPGMKASGITWNAANLDPYLAAPTKVIKGGTMPVNVPSAAERADLIAYLEKF